LTASRGFPRIGVEEGHPMSFDSRPAMPTLPARRAAFKARHDGLVTRIATSITVLAAAIAVFIAAALAVAFTIA
jgi:hypothetical protein